MPSVRGWILIPYLPHKAIKSSVSTNPPSRKAASARFNDVLSRASSCRCRHFPVRSALVPVFGLPQHTVRAYGCDAPSTAGHPNPVLRRLPRKTTESTGSSPYGVARRLAGCELPQSALRYIPCGASLFETNVADAQYDDNYIVRLTEPVFYNGIPSDVFVQEGHIFIGRDDPVIPTCGLTQ